MGRNPDSAVLSSWMRDVWLTAIDLAVTLGVLACGLVTHHRWLGALTGAWLALTLRQSLLAVRARRVRRSV